MHTNMKFKSMARVSTELSSPIRISFITCLQHLPSFPASKWSLYNFTLLICSDDELNRIRTISLQILRYSCSKHIFTFDKIDLKWFFDSKKKPLVRALGTFKYCSTWEFNFKTQEMVEEDWSSPNPTPRQSELKLREGCEKASRFRVY